MLHQRMAQHFPQTPLKERSSTTTLRLRALMEHQQRMEIGARIRELRETSPETNRSIADYVGVGERSVANWLSGDTGITYKNAKKVAELFEVDVRWLWDGRERGETPDPLMALHANQLDRIEEKLDELLRRLSPEEPSEDVDEALREAERAAEDASQDADEQARSSERSAEENP